MNKIILLSLLFFLNPLSSFAEPVDTNEQIFIRFIKDSIYNLELDQSIWPSFNMTELASIIHFENQHVYALNFSPNHPAWQLKTVGDDSFYFMPTNELKIKQPISCSAPIDGQLAYVYKYNNEVLPERNKQRFTHERFHCYQNDQFVPGVDDLTNYAGFIQLDNIKLAYLETEALKAYLVSSNIEALKDYAAINLLRSKYLSNDAIKYEEQQERTEGIANYVTWRVAYPDPEERRHAMFRENDRDDYCAPSNAIDCMIKQHYFFTGAAIAWALDQLDTSSWKPLIEKNITTPRERLFSLLTLENDEILPRVVAAKQHYLINEKAIEDAVIHYQDLAKQ